MVTCRPSPQVPGLAAVSVIFFAASFSCGVMSIVAAASPALVIRTTSAVLPPLL